MLRYAPVALRPTVASPTARRVGPPTWSPTISVSSRKGSSKSLGETFDQLFNWSGTTGDVIRLLFHGATAYLGYHVWLTDRGFVKWFGLFLGMGQTVGAICDLVSLWKRATGTHPPEQAR
jgi:hypothetical protein